MIIGFKATQPVSHARRHRGFTLVECLVSIVIVVIGLLAAAQCLNAAMVMVQRSNRYALGSAVCQKAIDDLRSFSIDGYVADAMVRQSNNEDVTVTTDAGGNTTVTDGLATEYDLPGGQLTVKIIPYTDSGLTAINGKIRSVSVDVTWNSKTTKPEQVTLTTLISNRTKGAGG